MEIIWGILLRALSCSLKTNKVILSVLHNNAEVLQVFLALLLPLSLLLIPCSAESKT